MVDRNIIERNIASIREHLVELEKVRSISFSDYTGDFRMRKFIERSLHVMIEAALDIAQHIIADEGFREAESYRDTFIILKEQGILPEDEIENYKKMALFRNILVHHYEKIDDDIVFQALKSRLGDFEKFISHILAYLGKNTDAGNFRT